MEDETHSTLCAVTAPTGLAAYNVGGVTIHRLLQLPIEHEGRGAGYWKLAKDALKIMRASLSKLKLLIIDEVSMVSSLNLAYIHLRLDEIFARDEWFSGVNALFVGDILQLPPVNGAAVFEKINNRSVTTKRGSMTPVNILQPPGSIPTRGSSEGEECWSRRPATPRRPPALPDTFTA